MVASIFMTGALKMVAMKKMKLTMMVTNLRMATATRIDKNDDEREEAHEEAQEEKEEILLATKPPSMPKTRQMPPKLQG
ncbi:hypothetical protein AK812_SmicGene37766 [Symbiodinium microadriaticum]|uniref:Uncharacterized protein n=1 Tax=Symbiodinium microadriaticum TaxID=2951 RepID=A0A1Q9CFG3_SYMMI|nr:hypothetical protein AK812_SmicGene37766 [Symbiodinium microadriaticum]CAE7239224.1 unnamed protein product [Symbiodinium microadriaticum]